MGGEHLLDVLSHLEFPCLDYLFALQIDGKTYVGFVNRFADEEAKKAHPYHAGKDRRPSPAHSTLMKHVVCLIRGEGALLSLTSASICDRSTCVIQLPCGYPTARPMLAPFPMQLQLIVMKEAPSDGTIGAVSRREALNAELALGAATQSSQSASQASKQLPIAEREAALSRFVEDSWLAEHPDGGGLTLGPRSLLELGGYLCSLPDIPESTARLLQTRVA